jgi:dTDP-3,4-didehydro-2,6-dideoxy-alpha-D-glucose 3-reductase
VGNNEPLRVGVLGFSDIARRRFLPALAASSQALLVAVGSRERERVAARLAKPTCPVVGYEELLSQDNIDLVYISLPNHLHEQWAIRALERGKHVICEKPLGLSVAAVERMLEAAEKQGLLLFENLMFMYHPQHAVVQELLAAGRIGRLKVLHSVFCIPLPAPGTFRRDPTQGGGAIHDLVRYPLATALLYFRGDLGDFCGIDHIQEQMTLSLQGSALSSAEEELRFFIAFDQPYASFYEVIGDAGTIRVNRAYTPPADLEGHIKLTCGGEETLFAVPAADQFRLMLDHVCALVRSGGVFRPVHERSRNLAHFVEELEKYCHHMHD